MRIEVLLICITVSIHLSINRTAHIRRETEQYVMKRQHLASEGFLCLSATKSCNYICFFSKYQKAKQGCFHCATSSYSFFLFFNALVSLQQSTISYIVISIWLLHVCNIRACMRMTGKGEWANEMYFRVPLWPPFCVCVWCAHLSDRTAFALGWAPDTSQIARFHSWICSGLYLPQITFLKQSLITLIRRGWNMEVGGIAKSAQVSCNWGLTWKNPDLGSY